MDTHPFLAQFFRVAYGCMACDGDIGESEIACLRSIAVQMNQPVAKIDAELATIRGEFSRDPVAMVDESKRALCDGKMSYADGVILLDMLVQLVEADGDIRVSESQYVRNAVVDLALDRSRLAREHPEWREYLRRGFHDGTSGRASLAGAFLKAMDDGVGPEG